MENVKSGRMSIYMAAKFYKISKFALFKHVKSSKGVKSPTLGRNQLLSPSKN
jgi:hypothetical protein